MENMITLKEACDKYIEYLKTTGNKESTIGTAQRILKLLIDDMGEDKDVAKILHVHTSKFLNGETATMRKTKDGTVKVRAAASIAQIRRIVRMALVWFNEQGFSDKIPLPAEDKQFVEKKERAKLAKLPKPKKPKKEKVQKPLATPDDLPKEDEPEPVKSMKFE